MIYFINEKAFSFKEKFDIIDEDGNIAYQVESKFYLIGKKTKIYDKNGNEIIYLEQELFHIKPHIYLYYKGDFKCMIKKKITFLYNEYVVPEFNIMIDSGFMNLDFNVIDKNTYDIIAKISKKMFSVGDKYIIEVMDKDRLDIIIGIFIACALIIKMGQ